MVFLKNANGPLQYTSAESECLPVSRVAWQQAIGRGLPHLHHRDTFPIRERITSNLRVGFSRMPPVDLLPPLPPLCSSSQSYCLVCIYVYGYWHFTQSAVNPTCTFLLGFQIVYCYYIFNLWFGAVIVCCCWSNSPCLEYKRKPILPSGLKANEWFCCSLCFAVQLPGATAPSSAAWRPLKASWCNHASVLYCFLKCFPFLEQKS